MPPTRQSLCEQWVCWQPDRLDQRRVLLATDTRGSAFAIASGTYRGLVVLSEFIRRDVRASIEAVGVKDDPGAVLSGQLLRMDAWLRTLCKLNEPADFQAVAAATRSLLESVVDIVLIHNTPADHLKVLAWEQSTKLNYAEKLVAHLLRSGTGQSLQHAAVINFAKNSKAHVEDLRRKYHWEDRKKRKTRHPDRWTNRNLSDDVRAADKCGHRFGFEAFYEVEYRKLCWMVHGSALALRDIGPTIFAGLPGLLFPPCGEMGLLASEIVLRHIGAWSNEVAGQFDGARQRRNVVAGQTIRAAQGEAPVSTPDK